MLPPASHVPGTPPPGDPPKALLRLADSIRHPAVCSAGISSTADGRWALYLSVQQTAQVPLVEIEANSGGYPVVYEAAPEGPARAYPAAKRQR